MEIAVYACLIIGLFVNAMSVVGLFRFPDIYTRLHAATKTTTFGSIFIVAAVIIESLIHYQQANLTLIFHSAIALLVIIFTNPISAHAIARAAILSGIRPYGVKINEFKEKEKELKGNKE